MSKSSLSFVCDFGALPEEQKPREKLATYGPASLKLWELVALIFRTGEKHQGGYFEDVQVLSRRVLMEAGFKGLFLQSNIDEVRTNLNLYKSHAETIVAISEIVRRLNGKYDIFDASEPTKIFDKYKKLQKSKQEQCHVLHVDSNNKCIFSELVAMGTRDFVQVYPTDVLRSAIWLGARKIIIVHNHSGHAHASAEDISWTLGLARGAWDLHKIKISDHVIIGEDGYFSFEENNLL